MNFTALKRIAINRPIGVRMRNITLVITALLLSSLFSEAARAQTEQFHLTAKDGVSLNGQIDFPADSAIKGVILLVPGTGLFDRDVKFGQTNTEKDLIFKEIAKSLTARHFAVVRFDYRGVNCNGNSGTAKQCIDNQIRAGVTPENIRDDIETIYNSAIANKKLAGKKVLVFGHSEGSLHLSYLIAQKRIQPHAVIFMGGLAESPQAVIHWQLTERFSSALFEFDSNSDGIVDNDEIKVGHAKKLNFLYQLPVEVLFSPKGSWTHQALNTYLEDSYQLVKAEALSHTDDEPMGANGLVQASYRWWKMYFTDNQPVIENLANFKGQIYYLNGSIDSQTNFTRQNDELKRTETAFSLKPQIVKVENMGHSLGADQIFGPIHPSSLELIGNTCLKLIEQKANQVSKNL
ncbi:MAG: hypothetical protein J7501_13360 [Bdellovibrio sp.]|nr:hypothetical protein [Bdellovibrio sp.]